MTILTSFGILGLVPTWLLYSQKQMTLLLSVLSKAAGGAKFEGGGHLLILYAGKTQDKFYLFKLILENLPILAVSPL